MPALQQRQLKDAEEFVMGRLFSVVAVCLIVASSTYAADPEPRFKGKPLGYWVERLQKAETDAELAAAAMAVGAFGADAKPAIPVLMEMMLDHSKDYRWRIAGILKELGSNAKFAVPGLVEMLKAKKSRDAVEVIWILEAYGPEAHEAVPILIESLKDSRLRGDAFEALCAIGPGAKSAIPALKTALNELQKPPANELENLARRRGDIPTAHNLASKLTGIGAEAIPLLLELLQSEDWPMRESSAEALGKIGPTATAAASQLQELLKDKNDSVRLVAATALWKIKKDPAAIETLIVLIGVHEPRPGYAWSMREFAASILGEIGPEAKSALPTLKSWREKAVESGPLDTRIDTIEHAIAAIEGNVIQGPVRR